ncbi:hypothetical protein [Isoptericola sp. NPDC057391]|uniref:hypothetical protein n=1 Tax=Isoptericola sp. NPDC057391 TaxID=3346117 RepID=UPI00362B3EE0
MTSHTAPSRTALAIAGQRGFGEHRAAYPVNRSHDRAMNVALVALVVAPVPFLAMAWAASPWSSPGAGPSTAGSVVGTIASAAAGLAFLGLALWLGIPGLLASFSHPHATVHLFERGAVAIRHRGGSYSWPYENAQARYVVWQEAWEGELRDRPQLWVTFRDGETICFDGHSERDRAVLPDLAAALGGDREPEPLGELLSYETPTPF